MMDFFINYWIKQLKILLKVLNEASDVTDQVTVEKPPKPQRSTSEAVCGGWGETQASASSRPSLFAPDSKSILAIQQETQLTCTAIANKYLLYTYTRSHHKCPTLNNLQLQTPSHSTVLPKLQQQTTKAGINVWVSITVAQKKVPPNNNDIHINQSVQDGKQRSNQATTKLTENQSS